MRWKLPGEDLITGRSSCQLRRATKGNTGSGNAGVADWFLVVTFELVQSCDAGWLNRSETLSKVTAYLGTSTLPVLTATLKSGWKMLQLHSPTPAVTSGTSDLLKHDKRCEPPQAPRTAHAQHGEEKPEEAPAAVHIPDLARQGEASLSPAPPPSVRAQEVMFGLLKQTVKQRGYHVHLLYLRLCVIMITGRLLMNCTSSKRRPTMLYIIVSHKANTEISNCLIFYLKKCL